MLALIIDDAHYSYQRMLLNKLEQIHANGDPARYRAYFPRYLLKCPQDHCHHHHETLYRELKHASYSIEHILNGLPNSQPDYTTVLAQALCQVTEISVRSRTKTFFKKNEKK